MTEIYRPWGNIDWIIKNFPRSTKWFFIGAISTEDRTIAAYNFLKENSNIIIKSHFMVINDKQSRHTQVCKHKIATNRKRLSKYDEESEFYLLYEYDNIIVDFAKTISHNHQNIIFDISCLPKRFFFPLLRRFQTDNNIENVIITNAIPLKYEHSQPLSESYGNWRTIPLFQDLSDEATKAIILFSVGHLPMGAPGPIYDICNSKKLILYFPFPGHPHSLNPIWRLVYEIEKTIENSDSIEIECVSACDTSEMFESMKRATNDGQTNAILAPYGPKPFSLAMALFAIKFNQPVYYTQPRIYHPDYSSGIQIKDGMPVINAYVTKCNAKSYY